MFERGIDRIALVLAFIAMLPGFVLGFHIHRSEFRIGVGLSSALASFLIVLYGIRGGVQFFKWIAGGSNDSNLEKKQNYWQEVIENENKIFIVLHQKTVEAFGTKGIKEKWGTYYKSKGKYYVIVNKNSHKKMLGKRWKMSIEEVEQNEGWQSLMKESNREKRKVAKYLERQRGDVSPGGGTSGSASDWKI